MVSWAGSCIHTQLAMVVHDRDVEGEMLGADTWWIDGVLMVVLFVCICVLR